MTYEKHHTPKLAQLEHSAEGSPPHWMKAPIPSNEQRARSIEEEYYSATTSAREASKTQAVLGAFQVLMVETGWPVARKQFEPEAIANDKLELNTFASWMATHAHPDPSKLAEYLQIEESIAELTGRYQHEESGEPLVTFRRQHPRPLDRQLAWDRTFELIYGERPEQRWWDFKWKNVHGSLREGPFGFYLRVRDELVKSYTPEVQRERQILTRVLAPTEQRIIAPEQESVFTPEEAALLLKTEAEVRAVIGIGEDVKIAEKFAIIDTRQSPRDPYDPNRAMPFLLNPRISVPRGLVAVAFHPGEEKLNEDRLMVLGGEGQESLGEDAAKRKGSLMNALFDGRLNEGVVGDHALFAWTSDGTLTLTNLIPENMTHLQEAFAQRQPTKVGAHALARSVHN